MGVPKFYVMISERYPALSSVVKNSQIPEFDNLYLDMNGIIHNCSHPNDADAYFRITENEIFDNIFNYIEVLFDIIKPRKVFFMAVDGVAPRAKMNQQRSRRFRSAKEAQAEVQKALKTNKEAPKEVMFDSNCITPGTKFMDRLDKALNDFVLYKVNTDPLWRLPTIIYSGHATPGEGEHKIMDYIRYARSKPGYNPRTRHCLYGLDADLIMLSLVSHEPLFTLLREEVIFNKKSNNKLTSASDTNYHLLHISLLRDYLAHEFQALKHSLKVKFDLEKVIDDWILIAFLTGNDFIPHLPHFHIHNNILSTLWDTYIKVLPDLDGYLNEGGKLNLNRFELFLKALHRLDISWFEEHMDDVKYLESKRRGRGKGRRLDASINVTQHNAAIDEVADALNDDDDGEMKELVAWEADDDDDDEGALDGELESKMNKSLSSDLAGIQSASDFIKQLSLPDVHKLHTPPSDSKLDKNMNNSFDLTLPQEPSTYIKETFERYKRGYYEEKLKIEHFNEEARQRVALDYIKTLQWILHYYYDGIQSWSWFYPHHYSPFVSDLYNLGSLQLTFSKGEPFKPFQQLLAVLPRASKQLLPSAYQCLMDKSSVICDFYPEDFMTDLNGKMRDWEAVVLIPFIDEKRMLDSMQAHHHKLTKEEVARNTFGPHKMVKYDGDVGEGVGLSLKHPVNGCTYLENNMASVKNIDAFEFCIEPRHILKGLCVQMAQTLHKYESGFPSLSFKKHTAELGKVNVTVFGTRMSRNASMALTLADNDVDDDEDDDDIRCRLDEKEAMEAGKMMLNTPQCVGWPHMVEVLVTAVCWGANRAYRDNKGVMRVVATKEDVEEKYFEFEKRYLKRYGIIMSGSRVMLECRPSLGTQYVVEGPNKVLEKITWSDKKVFYPLHTLVPNLLGKSHSVKTSILGISDLFPLGSSVVCTLPMYYGAVGKVLMLGSKIKVDLTLLDNFKPKIPQNPYMPAGKLASQSGISGLLVSKLTGNVFIHQKGRKVNVGLKLKSNVKRLMVPGYSMKETNDWLYSANVIPLLRAYQSNFPEVFRAIKDSEKNDFELNEVFKDEDREEKLDKLNKFLSELPCAKVPPRPIQDSVLDDDVRRVMTISLDNRPRKPPMHHTLDVLPRFLLSSSPQYSNMLSTCGHEMKDRVVNISVTSMVPFGAPGTVVAVYRDEMGMRDDTYDVLFDDATPGKKDRVFTLKRSGLLNLSQGRQSSSSSSSNHNNNNNQPIKTQPQITIAKKNGEDAASNVNNHNTNSSNSINKNTRLTISELFSYSKGGTKQQQKPQLVPQVANLFKHHQKSTMNHHVPNNNSEANNVKQQSHHNQHITQQFYQIMQQQVKPPNLMNNTHQLNQKTAYQILLKKAQHNLQYNTQSQQGVICNAPIQQGVHNPSNKQHNTHHQMPNNNKQHNTHHQTHNNQHNTHPQMPSNNNNQYLTHPQKPNNHQHTTHPHKPNNNNHHHNKHQPLKNTQHSHASFAPPPPPDHWLQNKSKTSNGVTTLPRGHVPVTAPMKEENIMDILRRAQSKLQDAKHNGGKQTTGSKHASAKHEKIPNKENEEKDLMKNFNKMVIKNKVHPKQQPQQPSKLHHAPSNLEKCEALLKMCQHMSLPPPLYSTITHPNNCIQVKVHLGDKRTYLGSKAASCQLAYQSAASVALERLHTPPLSYIPTQALMNNLKQKIGIKEKNKIPEKNEEQTNISEPSEVKDDKAETDEIKSERTNEEVGNNNNNNANDATTTIVERTNVEESARRNNKHYKKSSKKTRVVAQFNKSSK